jgi:hypothetical protein
MHPAKMTFQALRIAVNREYEELRLGLEASLNLLADYGKVCDMCDIPVRLLKMCQGVTVFSFFHGCLCLVFLFLLLHRLPY